MEYLPKENRAYRITNARAERIFAIPWLENFHISIEGHENTFANMSAAETALQSYKLFSVRQYETGTIFKKSL